MSGFVSAIAISLGAVSAGVTVYEKCIRRPRLEVEQRFSWLDKLGPDALVYQIDVRLAARHGDIYLHDVHLVNRLWPWQEREVGGLDPHEIKRLDVPRFFGRFEEALAYDLEPDAFAERIFLAGAGSSTRDLKIPAGGIMTVTAAGVVERPGAAANTRRCGWWLVMDYGVGRVEEKVFHDL